ncbi:MAG: hypothetical protein U1F34_01290 [Gammaproteobacteria bacterium]
MKRTLLDRYDRTNDGHIIIDVTATRAEDLYNNFDKSAPYIRRDLDQDLVDYLIGCAKEIRPQPFVLRFAFDHPLDESVQSRIRRSVNAYFVYLAESEQQRMMDMFRRAAIFLLIGLAILFLALSANRAPGVERSVLVNVVAEGLTVAAWVSLWESLAILLVEWPPYRRNTMLYKRLAGAEVNFRVDEAAKGEK